MLRTSVTSRRLKSRSGAISPPSFSRDADVERVRAHAARLGYDLDQSYRCCSYWPSGLRPTVREVVSRATARLGVEGPHAPIARTASCSIVAEDFRWAELATVLATDWETNVRLGVGGRYRLEEIKKSLADAEFALTLKGSPVDKPLAVYDELGRLAPARTAGRERPARTRGPLDRASHRLRRDHHSELLKTLVAYLEEFGALEATAAKLFVHRNSLRYRLVRIGELTGWDLNDPEQRFHLDLACRAFLVRQALAGSSPTLSGSQSRPARTATALRKAPGCLAAVQSPSAAPSPPRTRGRGQGALASPDRVMRTAVERR